jgi:hypothetical protein
VGETQNRVEVLQQQQQQFISYVAVFLIGSFPAVQGR